MRNESLLSTAAVRPSHASGAFLALSSAVVIGYLLATGALPLPAEPGRVTAAVDSAFDATGPLLPVASVLFVLWSCVALARQADLRLGAALLVQQVRTVVGVTAAIGVAYLALVAGLSEGPAVALATTGGLGAAAASDGMLDRLGRAVLRRWGEHAPEGPMRVTVYAAGTRAKVGATLRAAADEIDPPADADSQPQQAAEPTA